MKQLLDLLNEILSGDTMEEWHNAVLVKTDLAGERVVRDGIEPGRRYFVNTQDIRDDDLKGLLNGRRFGTRKTIGVYVQERERVERAPLELIDIGSPVNKYECELCGWIFFDWRDEATLKADRGGINPHGEKLGVTCSKCYEIVKPLAQNADVNRIATSHRIHVAVCDYCQWDIPCVHAKDIRDQMDQVHLGDGYTGAQVMRRLIAERVGPAMYRRKMRTRSELFASMFRM